MTKTANNQQKKGRKKRQMAKDAGGNEGGRESESERQREIGGALASVKERSWRGGRAVLNR